MKLYSKLLVNIVSIMSLAKTHTCTRLVTTSLRVSLAPSFMIVVSGRNSLYALYKFKKIIFLEIFQHLKEVIDVYAFSKDTPKKKKSNNVNAFNTYALVIRLQGRQQWLDYFYYIITSLLVVIVAL